MIVVFAGAMLVGFTAMVLASRRAVDSATELAAASQVPPFFIGVTLLAIGTDLPEIANSIAASVTGHGDVNVGDSVGSAATQATLILGLLPILGGALTVPKRGIAPTGMFTVGALVLLVGLLSDGHLGRFDALLLLSLWAIGSRVVYTKTSVNQQLTLSENVGSRGRLVGRTLVALVVVGASALLALWAIVGMADALDAPELLVSFFVASIGTSLPELAFNTTALRRGAVALAIGGVIGASFVDATLSVGIGPLIAPTDITSGLAVKATLAAAVAVGIVTMIMSRIETHDWRSGGILLTLYAGFFFVLL